MLCLYVACLRIQWTYARKMDLLLILLGYTPRFTLKNKSSCNPLSSFFEVDTSKCSLFLKSNFVVYGNSMFLFNIFGNLVYLGLRFLIVSIF